MKTTAYGDRTRQRFIVTLVLIGCLGLPIRTADALVTSDGHGTHTTEPGVPAFGVNVDGVVKLKYGSIAGGGASGFCTGSLISDRFVLTAAHCVDRLDALLLNNLQVEFDLVGGKVPVDVAGTIIHSGWTGDAQLGNDISLLELATAAPAAAPRYERFSGTNEVGQMFVAVGYGTTGFGGTGGDTFDGLKRAGLNLVDATGQETLSLLGIPPLPVAENVLVYDFDSGLAANDAFGSLGLPELGFGGDEVNGAPGDSGGPIFIQEEGVLKVAGIASLGAVHQLIAHLDVDSESNSSWGELGADTRVSPYNGFINDAVAGVLDPVRPVILIDGQTHVVDTADNDLFYVDDAADGSPTTLIVAGAGSVGSDTSPPVSAVFNSVVEVSGGTVRGGVALQHSADLTITAGAIHGGIAVSDSGNFVNGADSLITIRGGLLSGSISGLEMGYGFNALPSQSVANIENGVISGQQTGLAANGTSTVNMSGGMIEGGISGAPNEYGMKTHGQSQVNISGGTIQGTIGIRAWEDATLRISGGGISGIQDGISASGNAFVQIHGGTISGGQSGDEEEDGILIYGQAELELRSGTVRGSFGVTAFDDASVRIVDGGVTGTLVGLYAQDFAAVEILGGEIMADEGGGVEAYGDASVTLGGGSVQGDVGVLADEGAVIDILGGTIRGATVDLLVYGPDALIRIAGTNFNEPLGIVSPETGTLTGQFADGSNFAYSFERVDGGTILLVPEPRSFIFWAAGLLLIISFRRRANA